MSLGTLVAHDTLVKQSAFSMPNLLARMFVVTPATYLYAGAQEAKVRRGEPVGNLQNVIRKHPFLSSLVTSALAGQAIDILNKTSSFTRTTSKLFKGLPEHKFETLYNDIIGN